MKLPRKIQQFAASLSLCGAFGIAGCTESKASTGPAATCGTATCTPSCTAELRGNISGVVPLKEDCGTLGIAPDAGRDGTYLLAFHGSSAEIASADVAVYLGATPTPGTFAAQSVTSSRQRCRATLGGAAASLELGGKITS
jgi:hypothetical protein